MDELPTSPDRPDPDVPGRIALIAVTAILCAALWLSITEPWPGSFFRRYLLVSLCIANVANVAVARMEPNNAVKKRLSAVSTLALAFTAVGLLEAFL
jgi:hypothetical protein